jgi:hypothetical protein
MLCFLAQEGVRRMTEAELAPNLPGWMVEHANRYLSSGGTDGHMHKPTDRASLTSPYRRSEPLPRFPARRRQHPIAAKKPAQRND